MSKNTLQAAVSPAAMVVGFALNFTVGTAVAAGTSWDSTLSRALLDSAGAAAATPVAADMPMQITVSLKLQDKAAVDQLIKSQNTPGNPAYHQYLTPAQFAAQYSPTASQAQAVAQYLVDSGFQNVRISASRLLVGGTAPASVVQQAFNTKIEQFPFGGKTVYANATAAQVPSSLGGVVLGIGGLQSAFKMSTSSKKFDPAKAATLAAAASTNAAGPPSVITEFPPQGFQIAYDAVNTVAGSNTAVAISTYGDNIETQVLPDLRQAEKLFGLPYVPLTLRADNTIPTADLDTAGDGEWDLDTQSSSGIAQNLKALIVYTDDDTVVDNLLWEYAAFADAADAPIGNMSYGLCELFEDSTITNNPAVAAAFTAVYGNADGGLPTIAGSDQLFMQAVTEGLSWHASTGDSGGYCTVGNVMALPGTGVPGGANYPASSPYVVAVGGSNVTTDADYNYITEIAWTSGGGGVSVVENPPAWQVGIAPSALSTTAPGRSVPDIAMNSGSEVASTSETVVAGALGGYLGTSLSSPLAAGALARMQTDHCNQIGFAASAYYQLDTGGVGTTSTGFNDVILGSNSFYAALPGYDNTTGLGSIDVGKVDAALPAASGGCVPLSDTPVINAVNVSVSGDAVTLNICAADAADTLAYYVVDFGDGAMSNAVPDVQIQPTVAWPNQPTNADGSAISTYPSATPFTGDPSSFSHAYAADGSYTATVYVRNGHGTISDAMNVTIAAGTDSTGPAACSTVATTGTGTTTGGTTGTTGGTTGGSTGGSSGGTTGTTTTGGTTVSTTTGNTASSGTSGGASAFGFGTLLPLMLVAVQRRRRASRLEAEA